MFKWCKRVQIKLRGLGVDFGYFKKLNTVICNMCYTLVGVGRYLFLTPENVRVVVNLSLAGRLHSITQAFNGGIFLRALI